MAQANIQYTYKNMDHKKRAEHMFGGEVVKGDQFGRRGALMIILSASMADPENWRNTVLEIAPLENALNAGLVKERHSLPKQTLIHVVGKVMN